MKVKILIVVLIGISATLFFGCMSEEESPVTPYNTFSPTPTPTPPGPETPHPTPTPNSSFSFVICGMEVRGTVTKNTVSGQICNYNGTWVWYRVTDITHGVVIYEDLITGLNDGKCNDYGPVSFALPAEILVEVWCWPTYWDPPDCEGTHTVGGPG